MSSESELRHLKSAITHAGRRSEQEAISAFHRQLELTRTDRERILESARTFVRSSRGQPHKRSMLDLFLSEFALSTQEGIALLCISEALLRIPDNATAEALIADKIGRGDWTSHLGNSDSLFLNASTWGLMLTGNVIALGDDVTQNTAGWLKRLVGRLGESAAREAMLYGVNIVGREFVVGTDIESAFEVANRDFNRCSFDMLGEGARTYEAARIYTEAYRHAISYLGSRQGSKHVENRLGISVKLSALHPRFEPLQSNRLQDELYPVILELAVLAKENDVQLTVDAEEAVRLESTLSVFESLLTNPKMRGWHGLGLAVQAYSLRCGAVIDWLQSLAASVDSICNVRLVKGAYWDTELKRGQVDGLAQYPVFTRKPSTDLAWLACASKLFTYSNLYPQIATHNAFSIAAAMHLGRDQEFEFQRLHGMGELLYDVVHEHNQKMPPVRVYAPVGDHENLLSYLVRRLLENGANTSFVNRFLDDKYDVDEIVVDPIELVAGYGYQPHPSIPLPSLIFGDVRPNSLGIDLGDGEEMARLETSVANVTLDETAPVKSHKRDVEQAFRVLSEAFPLWQRTILTDRKKILFKLAESLDTNQITLCRLLQEEGGKTLVDAIAEIREAKDFCYYYGSQCVETFQSDSLPGPTGETNTLDYVGRGVFACISPWNFPLAIFLGQIAAALAAGNVVIAKPAEQTPRIARFIVELMFSSGFPPGVVQVVYGGADVGQLVVETASTAGVAFTGSLNTAKHINSTLAARPGSIVPLIAETGGVNAMVLDSSVLFEQAIDDVLISAFRSAGQRCSALRLLCIQDDIYDRFLSCLAQAMQTLIIGDARDFQTDVGPVIDNDAFARLTTYLDSVADRVVSSTPVPATFKRTHIAPSIVRVDDLTQIDQEHFGPILHVMSYADIERKQLLELLSSTGFGLTFGVQSRIDSRTREAVDMVRAGNMYINRNIIGATVGVQPFGGHSLSGTGPKAGGPNYLMRFAQEISVSKNLVATGGNTQLLNLPI